ncbi:tripartite tricarboxylate transporter permease [Saccharopolyspora sp. 5N708]|uniref:tripartite tricarboxylate transporter permease n=1 Tax=Saccharopolyspora sp. 5N708 TaxID=3457424 RepID=UPI003FD01F74
MNIISDLALGFSHVLTVQNLSYAVLGCALGMITGVLPGFGPSAATTLLLPLAFVVGPTASIVMISAIYYGSMYGGTITSVLLRVPGEVASVATCLDGYEMTRRGQAGKALSIAAIGSFIGGMIALLGMIFASQLADLALALGPPELFALSLLALGLVIGLAGKSVVKGLVSALLGLFVGAIGLDLVTGAPRFTMGIVELRDGVEFVAVIMGLFGLAEILEHIGSRTTVDFSGKIGSVRLSWQDFRESLGAIARGTGIGFFFGLVPGSPAAACSFASYAVEKRVSKTPHRFGKGAIQGVAGPETANNALAISNFIPLLTLGIPSSATMAILLGAFTINGLQPGPLLFAQQPEIAWGFIASLAVSNVILLIMALPMVRMWVAVLRIPPMVLYALTLGFMTVGAYTINNRVFDIAVMWIAGLIGLVLRRLDVPLAPAALTLVLGPMLEENFRRTLSIHQGSFAGFITSPVAIAAYLLIVLTIVVKAVGTIRGLAGRRAASRSSIDVVGHL